MSAFEEFERRMTWMRLAGELGQEDDFLALIAAERRDAVEEYKRRAIDWRDIFKRYAGVIEYRESYTYLTPEDWSASEWPEIIHALGEADLRPDTPIFKQEP